MPTLYDIAAEYQAILQAVEFLEGELDEGLESLLDQVEGAANSIHPMRERAPLRGASARPIAARRGVSVSAPP